MIRQFALLTVVLLLFTGNVFAENQVYFRLMPQYSDTLGSDYFKSSFGAAASLDWQFASFQPARGFGRYIGLGVSASGGFENLALVYGSSMNILDGALNLFSQWRLLDRLTVRADLGAGVYNYRRDNDSGNKIFWKGGLSAYCHLSPWFALFMDGAYASYIFSDNNPINSLKLGMGISLNLGEIMRPMTRIHAERTSQERIFPVSFSWYSQNKFATVEITNNEPNAISQVTLSFFLDRFMNDSTVFAVLPRLGPGETAEVPVTALFNESLLDLTDNINANTVITVDYRSLGARKQTQIPFDMMIFHRNAFSWDDDRRAAAFVSPRDSAAELFAKYTAQAARRYASSNQAAAGAPESAVLAAALFDTFPLYGINYIIDPASSYTALSSDASALDSINYPYQTLNFRGGDCDDLTILYCSLLETLGIESAFITIPGHIYAAFALNDNSWNIRSTDIIQYGGSRWIPVEITASRLGFAGAWRLGAQEWRTAGVKAKLLPVRESWQLYPSVTIPKSGDVLPDMPAEQDIINSLQTELGKLK